MRSVSLLLGMALCILAAPAMAGSRGANAPLHAVSDAPDILDDENTAPLTTQREEEKYAADTASLHIVDPALSPKAPELERLAEREALLLLWDQQLPATKAQMLDEAKRALEQGRGHSSPASCSGPKAVATKEMDALQAVLKRIRHLPAEEQEPAKTGLRACFERIAPPPGAPFPRAKPVLSRPRVGPAQLQRCRFKGLFGC